MNKFLIVAMLFTMATFFSCKQQGIAYDASGVFEADEVLVSPEVTGKIIAFDVQEGDSLTINDTVAKIDAGNIALQEEQVVASIGALKEKTNNVQPQIELLEKQYQVQKVQLATQQKEFERFSQLVKADAATPKQVDDIGAQILVIEKQLAVTVQQIAVQKSQSSTQNRGILSEKAPLEKRVAQLQDLQNRSIIKNPLTGIVIATYAHLGEMAAAGKALYKIADLNTLTLRAYVSGQQLPQIKIGQQITVFTDDGKGAYKPYKGVIRWISPKNEFTPKTIQTKDERANLVYAVKVKVPNDGYLKIGMYGELSLKPNP